MKKYVHMIIVCMYEYIMHWTFYHQHTLSRLKTFEGKLFLFVFSAGEAGMCRCQRCAGETLVNGTVVPARKRESCPTLSRRRGVAAARPNSGSGSRSSRAAGWEPGREPGRKGLGNGVLTIGPTTTTTRSGLRPLCKTYIPSWKLDFLREHQMERSSHHCWWWPEIEEGTGYS